MAKLLTVIVRGRGSNLQFPPAVTDQPESHFRKPHSVLEHWTCQSHHKRSPKCPRL